jgi:hypothetical protein
MFGHTALDARGVSKCHGEREALTPLVFGIAVSNSCLIIFTAIASHMFRSRNVVS